MGSYCFFLTECLSHSILSCNKNSNQQTLNVELFIIGIYHIYGLWCLFFHTTMIAQGLARSISIQLTMLVILQQSGVEKKIADLGS